MSDEVFIERSGDGIVLVGSPREKELVARIPGGRYDRDAAGTQWWFPLGWATCVAARGVFGARLQVGPELSAWSNVQHARQQHLKTLQALDVGPDGMPDISRWADLKDWQRPDAMWMAAAGGALNANDVGLGKTIETLMALKIMGPSIFPILIICPNSLKLKWARDFEAWGPAHGGLVVIDGTLAQKRKLLASDHAVTIINWDALRLHSRLAPFGSTELTETERTPKELDEMGYRTVIADEAHRAVNPAAKQTRAWWNLSHAARHRFGLTATPITGKPDDMWSLFHGIDPVNFPRKTAWVDRYCHAGQNLHGGYEVWGFKAETKPELFSYVDPIMIRRTGEVAGNEPPIFEERPVVMGAKQAKAYREMLKESLTEVDGEFLVAGNPLELRTRLRQLAAGLPVMGPSKRKDPETGQMVDCVGVVALSAPSCKVEALLDILEDEPDEPLVAFAESRKLVEMASNVLTKHKISHVLLTGLVPVNVRDQNIARFQDPDEGVRVALCTYGAVAEGISLGRSGHLVRLQVSGSMVQNNQALGRIDGLRRSKPGPIRCTDIITVGTVDEDVTVSNLEKAGHAEELLRDRLRRGG